MHESRAYFAWRIVKGGTSDYVVWIVGEKPEFYCSCMANYIYGKKCKHIKEVGRKMPLPLEKCVPSLSISSSLEGLNKVYGEPLYNNDVIVSLHGKPAVGKSLFAYQDTIHTMSLGYNALYIDTEGGLKEINKSWREIFVERFKVKNKNVGKGFVETRKTLESLLEFMGYGVELKYKEAKVELRISEVTESELEKFVEKNEIKYIVLDSVSMPICSAINDEQQNRPARATAMSLIMGVLNRVQEKYGCCVLAIHHSSWNPADPYQAFANIWGGKRIHHVSKRIIYMDMRDKSELKNFRRFWVARIEDDISYGKVVGAKITDVGIEDYEKVDELLTDSEKRKVGK